MPKANVKVINDDEILLSTKRCSAFFGVSPKTLLEWRKMGCPQESRGWWNPEDVLRWRSQVTSEDGKVEDENWIALKTKADALYKQAKAEQEKIRLQELKGLYMKKEEVYSEWANRLAVCKANMFTWSRTLASILVGRNLREIEKIIYDETYLLWEQYYREGPFTPRNVEGESVA
ncbi:MULTISPECIES: hypothetical protein [unclassified Aminobacterium]|jgi:hypothetical protein|uniref:hypothetical protein n=1 Tax=unclassified Aminobacterium TaxID=2685012 RepID=UPI00257D07D6|nr:MULTISPECIES: hypothetical protein [unclassified Aminobacterium]